MRQFTGTLLVKEQDPETSYIDYMAVKILVEDGREYVLFADHPKLRARDEEYVILNQGEELLIHFDDFPEDISQAEVYVIAKGYYEPYRFRYEESAPSLNGE